ncbi:hypothetical protein C9374_004240 [Naegleria lovaniensis]|uniref:Uncharacterized protein n=1 Tax=Naegleria lovaniensis TaxID=51637 RepID=A0AA88KJ52_NAELO|nr:uncharacterized protein C9374_004240 [Naegleria lovaniensis]KAG2383569.1 hypothetical protein C9374_004240 [Naegleria lovaniensis]
MIQYWEQYHCDGIPNTQFNTSSNEGVKYYDYVWNIVDVPSQEASYCDYVNANTNLYNQTMSLYSYFLNQTAMKEFFIPYLETLLPDSVYYNPKLYTRFFYVSEFQKKVDNTVALHHLVNAFNFYLFCQKGNPFFEHFHTTVLPRIASLGTFSQIQTLDLLFGKTLLQKYGKIDVTFYNRTQLAFCTDDNDHAFVLSYAPCDGVYVKFWVPLSKHLSLKIIEFIFYTLQFILFGILIGIPILYKTWTKLKDHIHHTQNVIIVERGKKQRSLKNPNNNLAPHTTSLSVMNEQSTTETTPTSPNSLSQLTIIDESNPNHQVGVDPSTKTSTATTAQPPKRESSPSPYKLSFWVILEFCVIYDFFLRFVSFESSDYGTAVHQNVAPLLSSLAFLCSGLIPLAGTFMEVLLTISQQNATVSIHALIIVSILLAIMVLVIIVILITAFSALNVTQTVRIVSLPIALVALVISWAIILSYSFKIFFMIRKQRKINFLNLSYLFSTSINLDTLFTRLFKHRVAGYILGIMLWGGCYVLFSKNNFKECYGFILKPCLKFKTPSSRGL